ncbi:AEC family transporter [Robbsia sp. KACC 23696]|uniref:AEC family transporter n=1 Tax=Robbsia sp. KACC 23696 TaxID=3149231 RepID=UPI00325C1330
MLAVFHALSPIVLLIAVGYLAGRVGWVKATSLGDFSNIVFCVLAPALLFRTMSKVHIAQLDFRPVAIYLSAMWVVFFAVFLRQGRNRRGAVMGLASTFSNTLMIGVPLVNIAFGDAGLVTLFALISVHSFIMLTMVTIVLEFVVVNEQSAAAVAAGALPPSGVARWHHLLRTVGKAMKGSILHPIPLPILCGIAFGLTGWSLPKMIDEPMRILGSAFSPMALVLVGVTLASSSIASGIKAAFMLSVMKNLVHPAVFIVIGLLLGLNGVPFKVMAVVASLPIGANVYLFAVRYRTAETEVTGSVALSTVMGVVTTALTMSIAQWLPE